MKLAKSKDGKLLAYFFRLSTPPQQTEFLTPIECPFQVGLVVRPKNGKIARHTHKEVERHLHTTTELILVKQGHCSIDIYDDDRSLITTENLNPGDSVVLVAGGHGFHMAEDTVLLEVKQGPYPGSDEKEFF